MAYMSYISILNLFNQYLWRGSFSCRDEIITERSCGVRLAIFEFIRRETGSDLYGLVYLLDSFKYCSWLIAHRL